MTPLTCDRKLKLFSDMKYKSSPYFGFRQNASVRGHGISRKDLWPRIIWRPAATVRFENRNGRIHVRLLFMNAPDFYL